MSYDYAMAKRLRGLSRPAPQAAWYRAVCAEDTPELVFSICDGEMKFHAELLLMTGTARSVAWQKGMTAAALLSGGRLLLLDTI